MQIKDKIAIVTGAAQGIGKAVCDAILQKQGKVCAADIDETLGTATVKELQTKYCDEAIVFFKCDVTKKTEQEDMFNYVEKKYGQIDIVCNNAGIINESYEHFDAVININLVGVITGCLLAIDHMKKTGGGVIINTNSLAGLHPCPPMPVYAASKWGVMGFSKSMALRPELPESNIRLNLVCPGFVRTRLEQFAHGNKISEKVLETCGLLEPSRVAEGFIQLIEDDTKHGAILDMKESKGFSFV